MSSSSRSLRDKTCAKIIEYGIFGLLIFSPLPAASVYEWSILVIQLFVLLMLGAFIIMEEKPHANASFTSVGRPAKYAFCGVLFLVLLQLLPLPAFLGKVISPAAYAFKNTYAMEIPKMSFISLSLVPSHTFQKGLEILPYFLLGFLVFKTVTRRRQIIRIWTVLVTMGAFEAAYGLFELYNKNPRILFYKKVYNLDSVTGTFVNRNHLSGYLEMIIPLAIGLLVARIGLYSQSASNWRERLLRLQEKGFALNLCLFLAVVIMGVAIVFSKSRSGIFVLFLTFILFFGLVAIHYEIYPLRKEWIKNVLKASLLVILLISFYFGIGAALERFSLDNLLQEERPTYWAYSLSTFADFPLIGTGLGTFGARAPIIENAERPVAMVHAHNDYLEYLSELGLLGFLLLFGGIFFVLIKSFLAWRERSHPEVKGLALGGIVSLICILTHSITDFNLHIPANMVLFSVVLPLTFVTAFYKRSASPQNTE